MIHAAGCGGGVLRRSCALATPPVITPSGTSTITVTMNACLPRGSLSTATLLLTLIVSSAAKQILACDIFLREFLVANAEVLAA